MSGQGLSAEEREALAGDVWQESDGVLLLCVVPGEWWQDFRGDRVPWNAPTIARPLRRLLDPQGNLVDTRLAQVTARADAAEAKVAAVRALAEAWLARADREQAASEAAGKNIGAMFDHRERASLLASAGETVLAALDSPTDVASTEAQQQEEDTP